MDAIEKAKELVQDAYYDERGMADVMRKDAAIWAAIAQAEAAQAQAHALERIAESLELALPMFSNTAMHLGNIHQTLITPDKKGEPTTAADQLKRIADALSL